MTEEEMNVVEAMERYGGAFVQGLSICFRRADRKNFDRLRKAFPHYWEQYENMISA